MNRLKRILALILALVLLISNLPAGTAANAAVPGDPAGNNQEQTGAGDNAGQPQAQNTDSVVVTLTADDSRIHRSNRVTAPAIEGGEYKMGVARGDLWYDYNTRKVIPSIYNLRTLMTDRVGTSSDTGINRYPYVVTKINVTQAGYYDLGVKVNMNPSCQIYSMAIVVDGTVHAVHLQSSGKQLVKAENVYLTAGVHSILYTCVLPQNGNEIPLNATQATFDANYYTWMNFWAFTFEGAAADTLEILDASTMTGTDVQNIFKESTRVEAENTNKVIWNAYNKAESNNAASGATVVGGLYYSNIKQTFDDLVNNGLDSAKTPYLQLTAVAPEAGTYFVTIGAYIGTSTNNANPVPYIAVIANDNAPVKAQFDGKWNGMDSVTVALELKQGENVIRWTSVTPDQYSTGTAWVNQDYIELQKGLTVKQPPRTSVGAEDADWASYVYLNRYTDSGSNFGGPNYHDMRWDYPSLYEDALGVYSDAMSGYAGRWPYIALRVNAQEAGYYNISTKIETSAAAKTVGMIVDGAMYVVGLTTINGVVTKSVYLTQGEHIIVFTPPIPKDMELIPAVNNNLYPWCNFYTFELSNGANFLEAPTLMQVQNSMKGISRIEAEDDSCVTVNGNYASNISKSYARRYSTYNVTIKGAEGAAIDGAVTAAEKLVNTQQTYAEIEAGGLDAAKTSYLEYVVKADAAGTYMIRIGAYVEGSGTVPYGTVLVNGVAYKAQFSCDWNGYDAVNLPVELVEGKNTIQLVGITADQADSDGWIGYDFVDVSKGVTPNAARREVSAANEDWSDYLYLNQYADDGNNFGKAAYGDFRWDYPSLYEDMIGIYSDAMPDKAGRWSYIAMCVKAEEAGYYEISAQIDTQAANLVGMIVDGAVYAADVVNKQITKSVYLSAGEHVIIFTLPMPRDMEIAKPDTNSLYPWINYCSFKVSAGLEFIEAPTAELVKSSMQNISRMEAEDTLCVIANGNYTADISKSYARRYSTYNVTIKGAEGAAIDGAVTAAEKLVNTQQTYAEMEAGGLDAAKTSYLEYVVKADTAGTYVIRIGAYIEGSGTMPYGTVLVNGVAYKTQFAGTWNGYEAVNLAVELVEGENTIQLVGITADQAEANGWIGYDFVDLPAGVSSVKTNNARREVSASHEDWTDYLHLNKYADCGTMFGDPGANTIYPDMRYDYPSLYEDMLGIYSDVKPERAGYWPYVAMRVSAQEAGYYEISTKIETTAAKTIGMIVDGAMYDASVANNQVTKSVYLSAGEHVIIFTAPMPRDMEIATGNVKELYPWINYCSFKLPAGLEFTEAPTAELVKSSMQNISRMEAEDTLCVIANGNYATDISKSYTRRYSTYNVTVMGAAGAAIDAAVTEEEKLANAQQTYAEIAADGLDAAKTSYLEYTVKADASGTYVIRIGAYVEGSGTMPYGTVLVNGVAYKAQFAGNWNGYDAVNLAVELKAGENTIQLIGITADQADSDGWIGYDFIDLTAGVVGVKVTTARREVGAANTDWSNYLTLGQYKDNGDNFGGPDYGHIRYDYPSLYEPMLGVYSDVMPDRAGYWPYVAMRVNAEEAGYYEISVQVDTTAAKTVGMIVDGVVYAADVVNKQVKESVYLSAGEHTIIFTAPMPQDMAIAFEKNDALYPWMNYCSFKLPAGLEFIEAPTAEQIKSAMQGISRVEVEDYAYATANGNYATDISKSYTRRYSTYNVTVMGAAGAAIDAAVTEEEKLANAQQTYAEIAADGLDAAKTSYLAYTVKSDAAGTYVIRIGAYIEGSGTVPYGTVLVNGTAYKAQFSGDWNGYDAVDLAVELKAGENTIQLIGITADQVDSDGWIGYDFVDLSSGVSGVKTNTARREVTASDEDWADYLYLNKYADCGTMFGDPGANTIYPDMRYDYPSLYEDMLGIYSDVKPGRAGYWPYIAMRVSVQEAGHYEISTKIETAAAKTVGMVVDGVVYAADVVNKQVKESVYLSAGEHTIIFTAPMPQDMAIAFEKNDALYPWMNYCSFKLPAGLEFIDAPTAEQIKSAMQGISCADAEDPLYASANGNYAADISKTYTRRYSTYNVTLKGAAGAAIDAIVTAEEKLVNTAQTYAELQAGGLDKEKTAYVQYGVNAPKAGTYVIRIGAYLEGSGTVPYGTVLVNGTAYKAQFSGDWNGYDAVNLAVELKEGKNTIQLIGITADQTSTNGWIGYDYLDLQSGLTAASVSDTTLINAGDETYVTFNNYKDNGDTLGGADCGDLQWDRLSIDMLNYAYLARMPYAAIKVTAKESGKYDIYFTAQAKAEATSKQIGILIDGVTAYPVALSGIRSHVTIELTKGTHTLVFTTPMPADMEAASKTDKFDKLAYPWMDMYTIAVGNGLVLEKAPDKTALEKPYVAVEVEDHAMPNLVKIMDTASGGGVYLKAQTAQQIVNDGIDSRVTPYVQYQIQASEAGEYTLYVALKSGFSGTLNSDRMKCSFVVENGSTRQVKTVYSFKDTANVLRVVPVTLKLEKGINEVRMTHFVGDSAQKTGYVWNDFDYIEMSAATANKLTFLETKVMEAEDGTYVSYQNQVSTSMSGGAYLGKGDYSFIDANRVTYDALDLEDMEDLNRVTYLFEAEKAGTYTIGVKFGMGLINRMPDECDKLGFAVIVNGKTKDFVEIKFASLSVQTTRLITVDLVEGENEVTFTSTLAENMNAVYPKIESEYWLAWADHDALYLSSGLSLGKAPEKFGVEDSGVGHPQLELWGLKAEPEDVQPTPDDVSTPASDLVTGIVIGTAVLVILAIVILIVVKSKKRKKN